MRQTPHRVVESNGLFAVQYYNWMYGEWMYALPFSDLHFLSILSTSSHALPASMERVTLTLSPMSGSCLVSVAGFRQSQVRAFRGGEEWVWVVLYDEVWLLLLLLSPVCFLVHTVILTP